MARYGGQTEGVYGGVGSFISGSSAITGGSIALDDGTVGSPSFQWASDNDGSGTGFYRRAANTITVSIGGSPAFEFSTNYRLPSNRNIGWNSGVNAFTASDDTSIGRQSAGLVVVNGATATPAGGSASAGPGMVFGSTAGFGIYIGSGVPTLSAAQGSLYLRSDGSSTSTRAYINTNGTTGWAAVTTAS